MKFYPVFYRCVCFICILMTLSLTSKSVSQETSDSAQAIIDAKNDIKEPVGWLAGSFLMASGLGCIGGSLAILASQVMTPSPPAHRFVGKSPEYVSFYIHTYQSNMKNRRLIYTSAGCLGGTVVAAVIWSRYYAPY